MGLCVHWKKLCSKSDYSTWNIQIFLSADLNSTLRVQQLPWLTTLRKPCLHNSYHFYGHPAAFELQGRCNRSDNLQSNRRVVNVGNGASLYVCGFRCHSLTASDNSPHKGHARCGFFVEMLRERKEAEATGRKTGRQYRKERPQTGG